MPRIVTYQPDQIQTQLVRQPQAQDAPAAAFGAPIAQGAFDIVKSAAAFKQRIDTTSAEEALVGFERDKNTAFFNPENGYFNTQGRDAYDGTAGINKSLEDLKTQYGKDLGVEAKVLFDKSADRHITRSQMDVARHASKGLKAWEISTIEAQVENTLENASLYWADPGQLKVQNVLGRQAIIDSSEMLGIGPEATAEKLQTFDSSFARSTIEAATQSSAADGKDALESVGDKLEGPYKVKMEKLIDTKEKIEKTESDARKATLTAGVLVDKHDDRADVTEEINKIEDPELRKKTMTEATNLFNRKKQAKKELENDAYQESIKQVNEGKSPLEIQATNPAAWDGMTDTQRNNILSGKHMITNQKLLNELRQLPTKQKAEIDVNDYSAELNTRDQAKLVTEVNAAKKGNPGSRVKSLASKSMLAAESAFGKKSKWAKRSGGQTTKGKAANEFLTELQDSIDEFEDNAQRKITPAEEDQIISDSTRAVVVERSAFGFDILAADTKIDLSNAPSPDLRTLNRVINDTPDINVDDLTQAYQFLVDNDQPVNSTTLRRVYSQGTK